MLSLKLRNAIRSLVVSSSVTGSSSCLSASRAFNSQGASSNAIKVQPTFDSATRNAFEKERISVYSPSFETKLNDFEMLLQAENEESQKDRENDEGAMILHGCEFEYENALFSNNGAIVELKFCSELSPEDYLKVSSFCKRPGIPFVLSLKKSTCHGESKLYSGIDVFFVELAKSSIKLKLRPKDFSLLRFMGGRSGIYKISSSENFPLTNLLELLCNRNKWSNYPGHKLMLYTYRAETMPLIEKDPDVKFLDASLNEEQRIAVKAALNPTRLVTAIHGPPGTGKTKVISEIVSQLVRDKKKVLVCAPSHKAVFNVLKCCHDRGLKNFCAIHGETSDFTNNIDRLVEDHQLGSGLKHLYDSLNGAMQNEELDKMDVLIKETKSLLNVIENDISKETMVVFCTISSLSVMKLMNKGFSPDTVIIDEAGQAMECSCWPLIFHGKRMVVVGDHNQLPAVVKSEEAKRLGFDISLIKWITDEFGQSINFPLKMQYRFNSTIQSWPSEQFYDGRLIAHENVANIRLSDLLKSNDKIVDDPLVLVDTDLFNAETARQLSKLYGVTCDKDFFVEQPHFLSKFNAGEAFLCAHHLKSLLTQLTPSQIGCVTPYKAQVGKIQSFLPVEAAEKLGVSSVDAFQGQEREAIVMSFVRNNFSHDIGFINDFRRLNVAVTRAKRQFLLVASSRMLRSDPVLVQLLKTIETKGKVIKPIELFKSI